MERVSAADKAKLKALFITKDHASGVDDKGAFVCFWNMRKNSKTNAYCEVQIIRDGLAFWEPCGLFGTADLLALIHTSLSLFSSSS